MKFLLDSNTCIRYLNQRSPLIIKKLHNTPERDIVVCSIVKAELFYGAMKSQYPQQTLQKQQLFLNRFASLPFDDQCALIYGQIRADLAIKGTPIGPNDALIAAIAMANSLTLVTHNIAEFSRIKGLQLEDWEIP